MQSLATGLPTSNDPAAEKTYTDNQENVVFGLPAVTNTAGILKERHILWTSVVSAGRNFHYLLTVVAQFLLSVALMLITLLPNVHTCYSFC